MCKLYVIFISEVIMLVGADDFRIHIYTEDESSQFKSVVCLEGHENWVQSLDVIKKGKENS